MKVSALAPLILSPVALAASRHTLRQASLKRGLVDVCVGLDLDVNLLDILPGGKPLVAGHLDLCLCLSVLPDFCKSNPVGKNVANLLGGEDKAHDFFANLIHSQPGSQQCSYPDHCEPICDITKPCHFGCKDGFVPDNRDHPTQCICPAPNTVCNGQCGSFPHGCTSAVPTPPAPGGNPPGPAPTPVPGHGPTCGQDIIDILLNLDLVADVAGIADIKARLDAAIAVGGVNGRDCDDLLRALIAANVVVHVDGIADLRAKLGLAVVVKRGGAPHNAQDIVDLLVHLNLLANVRDIATIKARLDAVIRVHGIDSHECHDLLEVLIGEHAIIHVLGLADLCDKLGIKATVLKRGGVPHNAQDIVDLLVHLNLLANVADVAAIWAQLDAIIRVHGIDSDECHHLLEVLIGEHSIINVLGIVDLCDKLGIKATVLKRGGVPHNAQDIVDLLVHLNLLANVADVAKIWAQLDAIIRVHGIDSDECHHLLEVLIGEHSIINVLGLVDLCDKLGIKATVLKRGGVPHNAQDIVDLLVHLDLLAHVADVADILARLDAIIRVYGIDSDECHHLLEVLIGEHSIIHVLGLVDLCDKLGISATVLRRRGSPETANDILDAIVLQGLVLDVAHLLRIKEILAAFVHIGPLSDDDCNRLLLLLLQADVLVGVTDLVGLRAKLGLAALVLRRETRGLASLD